jgi:hypothetical protein
MTKLCPRGKAAAKRKFKVYPSAYANAYASKICAGKIKDPSGVKRKDFRGSKAEGGRIGLNIGGSPKRQPNKNIQKGETTMGPVPADKRRPGKALTLEQKRLKLPMRGLKQDKRPRQNIKKPPRSKNPLQMLKDKVPLAKPRSKVAGGGLMEATARLKRQGLRGGGICTKGMNRDAIGKNS